MSTTVDSGTEGFSLERRWRTLALAGGVIALLGILAIAFPFATGLSMSYVVGALLVVSGVVHGVHTFSASGWTGRVWQLALAVVGIVAGLVVLANPLIGLLSLTLLLVAYLLVDGITELWMAARLEGQPGRGWIAASGAVSIVLAALLWAAFPGDAVWAVGLVVGVSLLATGLSMVIVAVAGRDGGDATLADAEAPHS
ncbi:HdeD family acid-resistance protein [Natronobiforma cellulositropha]|uniref:HdeD family acid-resistance protein n=1 Tax=Natronobiforma cellulositropha TaxID=1679076 RepID=UPI0021D5DAC8|nr:DUF308 domain-containing protein [Natronobiforma cellulositropha]